MDDPFGDANEFLRDALKRKPDLVVHGADRPETVRALLGLLRVDGELYDRGGVLVKLTRPSDGGPLVARELRPNNVIVEAHRHCQPVKYNDKGERVAITLPMAVAQMLLDLHEWGLKPLAGITTAPLLDADGNIISQAGYDPCRAMWCEPVPDLTVPNQPTFDEASAALHRLRQAFRTFPFAGSRLVVDGPLMVVDVTEPPSPAESAFLVGLLTACCRPSLWLAPGLLVVAPEVSGAGSGKGLLVRAICEIAYGNPPSAFTPGHDRQELDKRFVSALIEAKSAVFLDNANGMSLRSDTLASGPTERPAHVRLLQHSRMVPMNCTAFIAVTGNGLSVSEDLARRFVESALDPQCEDPETRPFPAGFLRSIRSRRLELLSAALTIWRYGRQNASALKRGLPLGSYEEWAEWVRDPLLSLGCCDPVEQVQQAKANDPHRRRIADLFAAWWENHQDRPVAAMQLATPVHVLLDPQGRGRQFVAARLTKLVSTRAGGFVLTSEAPAGKWGAHTYALRQNGSERQSTSSSTAGQANQPADNERGPMLPMPAYDFEPHATDAAQEWEQDL